MILQIRKIDGKILQVFKSKIHCKTQLKLTSTGYNSFKIKASPEGYYISELTAKNVRDLRKEGFKY